MTKSCVLTFVTASGTGVAEVDVNSLHQLAILMPASVISYEVHDNGERPRSPVLDSELYDLLLGVISDIDSQNFRA